MKTNVELNKYNQDWYSRGRSKLVVMMWWFVQSTLFRLSLHNMYSWRRFLLTLFGAKIGQGVRVRASAKFLYPWKVEIGSYSWIGDQVEFYSLDRIKIGEHCVISQKSYLCTGSHDIQDPQFGLITKPIHIENGAWVATDVFVYPGVIIQEKAVVAARSTVTRNVPRNEVHAGMPAKFLKFRFEEGK